MAPARRREALVEGHIGLASVAQRIEANGGELQLRLSLAQGRGSWRRCWIRSRARRPLDLRWLRRGAAVQQAGPPRDGSPARSRRPSHPGSSEWCAPAAVRIADRGVGRRVSRRLGSRRAGSGTGSGAGAAGASAAGDFGRRAGQALGCGFRGPVPPVRRSPRHASPCRPGRPSRWRPVRCRLTGRESNSRRSSGPRPRRLSEEPCLPFPLRPWRQARRHRGWRLLRLRFRGLLHKPPAAAAARRLRHQLRRRLRPRRHLHRPSCRRPPSLPEPKSLADGVCASAASGPIGASAASALPFRRSSER